MGSRGIANRQNAAGSSNIGSANGGVDSINLAAARGTSGTSAQGQTIANGAALSINGAIFKRFDFNIDVIPSTREIVSDTCWNDADGYLTSFFTSSAELLYSSSNYYYNIYQNATSAVSSSDPQFAIAYGNSNGAGGVTGSAALYTGNLTGSRTPTKAIYSQYKNILLLPTDDLFTFGNTSSTSIQVININRARYKEKLDPGNWELKLTGTGTISLIDNSGASRNPTIGQSGRIFDVVSGSITGGTASAYTTVFGLCYPDVGIIVLNADALTKSTNGGITFNTASSVAPASSNNKTFYNALNAGGSFQARTEENISSTYYFVRVGHNEFNYTNNPTFVTGSIGLIRYSLFHTDPRVYITTVGMYNDQNELLAVAKLSKPLLKSFTREALIRCKIDF